MFNPVSTYRIQFHKAFNFNDFERIIPYLEKLGVATIYASPIFNATPGSMHGYDSVDPLTINPEIGTIEQLRSISEVLSKKGISWIQDIVPNHMAYHQHNKWLMSVLENGPNSPYKDYFDDSFSSDLYQGAIMVPFLGKDLDDAINDGEVGVALQNEQLVLSCSGQNWPLNYIAYSSLLNDTYAVAPQALKDLVAELKSLGGLSNPDAFVSAWEQWKERFGKLSHKQTAAKYFESLFKGLAADKGRIKEIAEAQYYRLCNWQETDQSINYRRFFTVNGLICLNIHHDKVFADVHKLILTLLQENVFQGLRIDHVDGLFDPTLYLQNLRQLAGDETYIVVEKILGRKEELAKWPIEGTTGYDFLSQVNNLFTYRDREAAFTEFYHQLTQNDKPVQQQILEKKKYILERHMGGELDNLADLFIGTAKITTIRNEIKQAIAAFLVNCPVYRFYGNRFPLEASEAKSVKKILNKIKEADAALTVAVDLLEQMLLGNDDDNTRRGLEFYQRCMQFTGPLMAKGVEDTLMYTYERFSGHNEVGDAPDAFGISADQFHDAMLNRQENWPLAMNSTATHDTKRGEDVRARLNVLPDIAAEWLAAIQKWRTQNMNLKQIGAPDANDEYFIYQSLIGTYPMPADEDVNYHDRLQAYLEKTMREAKIHSDWAEPDVAYEDAVKQFAAALLNKETPFWKSFAKLHKKVTDFGIVNSLAQVMLKFTCPGVPDTYQGCDHWDLSMVDPDNRRPVDYALRNKILSKAKKATLKELWKNRVNGNIKTWLVQQLMLKRKEQKLFFATAGYLPLPVKGRYAGHVFAFARFSQFKWYITIIPLNLARMCAGQGKQNPNPDWEDTHIVIPDGAPSSYKNLIDGAKGNISSTIQVADVFNTVPFAWLELSTPASGRSSGLLMHVTSLPSAFGIGDIGPGARQFADLLHQTKQHYWQLLPLSPADADNHYSPYSSTSSMAGNTLLISPELLMADGLIKRDFLDAHQVDAKHKVDYQAASALKELIFDEAWLNFKEIGGYYLTRQFEEFCNSEISWLSNHSLYMVLKQQLQHTPWYQWPQHFKLREKAALADFEAEHQDAIDKEKWLQFIFFRQWSQLKTYCNNLGIHFLGDLPFYVSYDSADVWANPDLFSLDEQGNLEEIAGVPPDYFNANGQLWGMPVFNWTIHKAEKYNWWIQRVRKNLEMFNLLRLDHFRAFSAYWAVPAGEETAVNGCWNKGPASDIFSAFKTEFGKLPFIAEDLGDIDDDVYQLRDAFGLPGMRVLQFAFNDDVALSPHAPHNYSVNSVVYTGTHDNNTTRGWFQTEANKKTRKKIKAYTGKHIRDGRVNEVFIQMVMASVAKICIIPFQDILGLDESARMNIPAVAAGNWQWRVKSLKISSKVKKQLLDYTRMYNRITG